MPSSVWVHHGQLIAWSLGNRNPVIFQSRHADIPAAVAAMAKGALKFVEKPATDGALASLIRQALRLEEMWQKQGRRYDSLHSMWDTLAPELWRVALGVAAGNINSVIASEPGIVQRAVEMTRSRVFEMFGVDSAAELATTFADMRACGIDTSADEALGHKGPTAL